MEEPKRDNILTAVLALLKELDETSLEIVKKETEKRISNYIYHNFQHLNSDDLIKLNLLLHYVVN